MNCITYSLCKLKTSHSCVCCGEQKSSDPQKTIFLEPKQNRSQYPAKQFTFSLFNSSIQQCLSFSLTQSHSHTNNQSNSIQETKILLKDQSTKIHHHLSLSLCVFSFFLNHIFSFHHSTNPHVRKREWER